MNSSNFFLQQSETFICFGQKTFIFMMPKKLLKVHTSKLSSIKIEDIYLIYVFLFDVFFLSKICSLVYSILSIQLIPFIYEIRNKTLFTLISKYFH